MVSQTKVTGMVLSVMPIGEYDRRVMILTKERGKICAFARGVRRSTSHLLASTQIFAFGEFFVTEGRNAYTLTGAEISHYFEETRENPVSYTHLDVYKRQDYRHCDSLYGQSRQRGPG